VLIRIISPWLYKPTAVFVLRYIIILPRATLLLAMYIYFTYDYSRVTWNSTFQRSEP